MAGDAGDGGDDVGRKLPLPKQEKVEKVYNSTSVQIGVAVIIGANFLTNIIEKQIDPYGDEHNDVFSALDLLYNIIFTIELCVNMYGHWFRPFWSSSWNVFDFVVVSIGIINMLKLPLPKAFSMLRMMRAFRVFRLFKRVASLNKIIVAIARAVPGVCNAFLILTIVMSIYSILAVEFYQNVGKIDTEACADVTPYVDVQECCKEFFKTARGHCVGEEYFGAFSKSLYSFFQVLTGESWSEAVARPVIWYYIDDPLRAVGSGLFFVSYVLITAFVLTNVVVAVLLDKMVDPDVHEATEEEDGGADGAGGEEKVEDKSKLALDAIDGQVAKLTSFSGNMRSDLDGARSEMVSLREQIDTILQFLQEKVVEK